jgi:hypothetical protein
MALEQQSQSLPCHAPYWEQRIKRAWFNHTQHCLSVCFVTAQAKRRLARGKWAQLFHSHDMPFCKRDGEMRVRVWNAFGALLPHDPAQNPRRGEPLAPNAQDLAHLPDKITVLHVLADLDLAAIRRCLAEGLIHARLTAKEANILVAELTGQPIPEPHANIGRRLRNFRNFLTGNLPTMTVSERNSVSSELRDLLALITAN